MINRNPVANTLETPLTISSSASQRKLQQALQEFHAVLTPEDIPTLSNTPLSTESILGVVSEVDGKGKKRKLRRFVSAFEPLLDFIQRYSTAVETIVSSNPQIAALVWGSVKVVIIVCASLISFSLSEMCAALRLPGLSQLFRFLRKVSGNVSDHWDRLSDLERIPGDLFRVF